jgi:hypothetical protein
MLVQNNLPENDQQIPKILLFLSNVSFLPGLVRLSWFRLSVRIDSAYRILGFY